MLPGPDRHHREQDPRFGEPKGTDPPTLADGEMSLGQIAGQEQDDHQLGDLAGLETDLGHAEIDQDPKPAAVGLEALDREAARSEGSIGRRSSSRAPVRNR